MTFMEGPRYNDGSIQGRISADAEWPNSRAEFSAKALAGLEPGTFPLAVTAVALGRVGDLMQEEHALSESVNVARLGQEMTSR